MFMCSSYALLAGRRLLPGGVAVGSCDAESCGSMASGLVGEMSFKLLPDIPPWLTFVLTVVSMLVRALLPPSLSFWSAIMH